MLIHDIFIIIGMLLGAALFGYFIGWFRKQHRYDELKEYIAALQDKNNRTQTDYNKIEKLLIDCQGKSTVSDIEPTKKEIKNKPKKKTTSKKTKPDNLTKIEGIGPKLFGILKDAGIENFKKLSNAKPEKISEILVKAGGNKYKRFDPTTWPDQAKLAADGKWNELNKWQDELKGGKA
ncbi:MAG: hypothetical protein K8R54_06625 [Bacteroidales bacterium]|nr:hypothetical protein [Bacteroidales bacterium]